MDYKEQWQDMKRWLREGIDYCNNKKYETSFTEEYDRLDNKANNLRLVLPYL